MALISKNNGNIRPDLLQTADLSIISNEECVQAYGNAIDLSNICAATVGKGVTACSSDSGGPLVQRGHLERDTLIGVVSWGHIPCGEVGMPSIFVQVSYFIDWINDEINAYENGLSLINN